MPACIIGHNHLPPAGNILEDDDKGQSTPKTCLHINFKSVVVENACETWIIIRMPLVSPVFSNLTSTQLLSNKMLTGAEPCNYGDL